MRNLKKVLAVILTVAMLASFMVPAFAAVSYLEEAKKLQAIGLFAGGEADLKLDEDVTRIQGLTFAIRAAGKEEEALAMTDEEVAAELAKFKDSDTVPSWNGNGPKYVAYAIKNGITVGDGQGNFKPLDKISGRAFLVFLLKTGMGYKDVTTLTAPDVAVEAGILTPSMAVIYAQAEDGIIRDDAAAILFGAATNGVNADGKTFIQALIDAGFVDAQTAIENGFVNVTELSVIGISATSAKTFLVKFNRAVTDDDKVTFDVKRGSTAATLT
ncbi:MAG: S-layer homology domain-containing protein, partial [Clostridiaceae bacterium]|nr:S-layer homology domain-containing protein [Clostridiaceae bacterium]